MVLIRLSLALSGREEAFDHGGHRTNELLRLHVIGLNLPLQQDAIVEGHEEPGCYVRIETLPQHSRLSEGSDHVRNELATLSLRIHDHAARVFVAGCVHPELHLQGGPGCVLLRLLPGDGQDPLDVLAQGHARVSHGRHLIRTLAYVVGEDYLEDLCLPGKMVIEGALRNVGFGDNLIDGRPAESRPDEDSIRRIQNALAGLLASASGKGGSGGHSVTPVSFTDESVSVRLDRRFGLVKGFTEQMNEFEQDLTENRTAIQASRAELIDRLRTLRDDDLRRTRRGGWSVQEVLRHVIDSEIAYARVIGVLRAQPAQIADASEEDVATVAAVIAALERYRAALTSAIEGVDEDAFYEVKSLGTTQYSVMSVLENVADHDHEHLGQIVKTIGA